MSDITTSAPIVETTPAPTTSSNVTTTTAPTTSGTPTTSNNVTTTASGILKDGASRIGKNMSNPIFLLLLVALFVLFIMLVNNNTATSSKFLSDSTDGIKYLLTSTPN